MEYLRLYLTRYFALVCISAILLIISIQNYHRHKRISICMNVITGLVLTLSVCDILETYGKDILNVPMATTFAYLGYVLRPVCLCTFIIMCGVSLSKTKWIIYGIPLLANFIIFTLAFIPGVKEHIFYFYIVEREGKLITNFGGGWLRYASHIISLGYLVWLIYLSITKLRARHISNSLSILICALFIIIAVVFESFFNETGEIHILYPTVGVSALQYYLFLYTEKTQIDSLTGLFNRETYYRDVIKMGKSVSGVIQFDMNGLKYINDNYGHIEGDKALAEIANMIFLSSKKDMYIYRVGGDEFIILAIKCSEESIKETISSFNERIKQTSYYCSVGYAFRNNDEQTLDEIIKESEKRMYEAKNLFYKNSPFDRRKQ